MAHDPCDINLREAPYSNFFLIIICCTSGQDVQSEVSGRDSGAKARLDALVAQFRDRQADSIAGWPMPGDDTVRRLGVKRRRQQHCARHERRQSA